MLNALSNALMEGHLIFATKRLNPNEVASIITTFQQPNLLPKKLSDNLSAAIKSNGNMLSEAIGSCNYLCYYKFHHNNVEGRKEMVNMLFPLNNVFQVSSI